MSYDYLKGHKCMAWTFMGNSRMYQALAAYGDRLSQVGLFSFKVSRTGIITESGVAISNMLTYINRWPHIKWLLTMSNDGTNSIFAALRDNTDGAQDTFLSEIVRIMEKYPWRDGIDIDLEKGDGYSTHAASTAMFRNIYNTVKDYDSSKLMNIRLPCMNSINGSVGGENWCVYGDLNAYCDTAAIMSYGMAWAGSAPGAVSPRDWLEGIYDYAVTVMNPEKIFFGLPAYGWNWQIYNLPANLGKTYRGTSNTYYAAKNWMTGQYNFTDDVPPQPFIPILAYWDDYDMVPWALPQVYDFMEGSFSEAPSAGTATFTLSPRHFIDVDGNECQLDRAFKLTCEMLRRKPDSALIWYEDFRDYGVLQTNYWTTLSGSWTVWREDEYSESRVYSQLDGSGKLAWRYDGFSDIHLRARLAFPATGSGKAGVFCGDLFCCLNYNTQAVELYNGSTLLGSYSQTIERTANADLRTNPSMYTVEMRIRGNKVRVYSGSSYTLRFTATVSGFSGGYAGYRSDNRTVCELLRLGDAWTYEPYERFDVTFPDGTVTQYGRISRSNATWDTEFQVFTLTSDIEEDATRSESISLDYEFYHSHELALTCGNDYTVTITPKDIDIWIARLFLGDADGFSILYYQDVDSLVYWANEAAYRWGVRGFAMWSLGQEDMRFWEALPKQI